MAARSVRGKTAIRFGPESAPDRPIVTAPRGAASQSRPAHATAGQSRPRPHRSTARGGAAGNVAGEETAEGRAPARAAVQTMVAKGLAGAPQAILIAMNGAVAF